VKNSSHSSEFLKLKHFVINQHVHIAGVCEQRS